MNSRAITANPAGPGLSYRQRMLVLGICSMSLLVVGLDATVVNVALPSIRHSLDASLAGLQWTVDAYTVVLASLLMLGGSTADRVGRKRIFQLGLVVFSLSSLLCALAPTLSVLIAARVLQAIGASMLSPVAMSIVRNVFVDPAERARAIGVWGAMFGLGMALGPVLGGALVDSVGWRSVFLVNVPIGALAILLTYLYVPESRADRPRRIDPIGQLLVIVGLASLTYAIIEGPDHGWGSAEIVTLLVVAALAFAALIPYELHRREPLLQVRFFRSLPLSGASAIAVCSFAALGAFLFLNTLYLQDVRGLSPLEAGLYLLPMAVMVLVCAPVSGRLVSIRGPRPSLLTAGIGMVVGVALLTQLKPDTSVGYLFTGYAIFGFGFGLVNPPITNTALSGMPASQAGVAAAVASTSRQVGLTLGVAIVGAIAGGSAALGSGTASDFTTAAEPAWWTILGIVSAVLVLAAVSTSRWAEATARRTAEALVETEGADDEAPPGTPPAAGPGLRERLGTRVSDARGRA
jgi:EmrB/QacA subfamily drug resistance transporter